MISRSTSSYSHWLEFVYTRMLSWRHFCARASNWVNDATSTFCYQALSTRNSFPLTKVRSRRMGKVLFSQVSLCSHWGVGGGRVPHIYPIISPSHGTSTAPMSFPGVPQLHPIILPLFPGDHPSQVRLEVRMVEGRYPRVLPVQVRMGRG